MLAASAALLIPGQSREALGLELMPIALVYITLSSLATFRATHSPRGITRDRLARFFIGELSAGLGLRRRARASRACSRRRICGGSGRRLPRRGSPANSTALARGLDHLPFCKRPATGEIDVTEKR